VTTLKAASAPANRTTAARRRHRFHGVCRAGGALLLPLLLLACAGPLHAPYKDASQHIDATEPRLRAATGAPLPDTRLHGATLVWAFATGECGQERWGAFDTARFAALNVAAFVAAGADYIVSTGGEAGAFTCGSADGMARFLARYDSPRLRGLDFDIEGRQTPAQIDALAQRAAELERSRPALRISFTLATHGSDDGSLRSLNATGEQVLASLQRHGVQRAIINLMTMNYGPADARWCVLRQGGGSCDMGLSALQAVHNVHHRYGMPYGRMAVTAMLGENDVAGNVFTPDDAALLVRGARQLQLAGVHWWSLDRDRPCAPGSPRVSPQCHGLPTLVPGRFGQLLGGAPQ
jgi:chitinase